MKLGLQIQFPILILKSQTINYRDRSTGQPGGGVAMYIHESIPARRRFDLEHAQLELVFVEVTYNYKRFVVGTCYRPPGMNSQSINTFISDLQSSLNEICIENPEALFLLGDFNDRCLSWNSDHIESELKNKLLDLVTSNNLFQIIDEFTHVTPHSSSLLDLIITDAPGYVIDHGTKSPLGDPFHCRIYCKINIHFNRETAYKRKIWNYNLVDYNSFTTSLLTAPWSLLDIFDDLEDAVDYFHNLFLKIAEEHIPNKTVIIRPRDKPWFTSRVRCEFRKRDRAHSKYKKNPTIENYTFYKHLRHEANKAKFIAKFEYNAKLSQRLVNPNTCPKEYWKITNNLYGNKVHSGIPPLLKNGVVHTSSIAKCNIFNKSFTDKAGLPDIKPNLPHVNVETPERLEFIETSEEEVAKLFKNLDVKKASGPDGISNRMLKIASKAISAPLCKLFNMSLRLAKFPSKWKEANVTPIYKKNDRQDDNNYRPISLLSCIGKLLERIVFINLYEFLFKNNLLTWRNSGYKQRDSTVNQLLYLTHQIYDALSRGLDVCFVSLDASSAFDRVWHEGLIHKLKKKGITGRLLQWFVDYQSDRKQRVIIGGSKSE